MNKKKHNNTNNILAFFYFVLIFAVIIYLFVALFGNSSNNLTETESIGIFSGGKINNNYNFIMNYPNFGITKR